MKKTIFSFCMTLFMAVLMTGCSSDDDEIFGTGLTGKWDLVEVQLTIGNERIVRRCNITDLQSIRKESRFWIGSLFFPKLADCLPTFVSFLSLAVLSLYRKLNA